MVVDAKVAVEILEEKVAMVCHEEVPVIWRGLGLVPMVWLGREEVPMVWLVEELVVDSELVWIWMVLSFWRKYWNILHGVRLSSLYRQ